jgi:hypothetical protein
MSKPIHRGLRCGLCYWALYDGRWCQNRECVNFGKSMVKNRVELSNEEAMVMIQAKKKTQSG